MQRKNNRKGDENGKWEADCLEYIDNTDKIIYLLYRRFFVREYML